jgi:hypothetical protein
MRTVAAALLAGCVSHLLCVKLRLSALRLQVTGQACTMPTQLLLQSLLLLLLPPPHHRQLLLQLQLRCA